MKTGILAAAGLAALLSSTAAYADCNGSCSAANAQCSRSGKDYATCMGAWHQCKTACNAPTPVKATPAPAGQAPKVTKAVAPR